MKKYGVYELIIEVTRRCNMCCAHCLRGEAEGKDITFQVIDNALKHFDSIGTITFTGGEPSLNVRAIKHALSYCKRHKIPVDSFFVATNGFDYVDALLKACDDWYNYTLSSEYGHNEYCQVSHAEIDHIIDMHDADYEMTSALALSSDPYHAPIPITNLYKLMSRSYFSDVKVNDFKHGVQARGRGQDIVNSFYHEPIKELEFNDENSIEQVYVTYDGSILADCDLAFEDMPGLSLGNVSNTKVFEEIYERQAQDEIND